MKVGGAIPFALRPLRRICFPETDARRAAPAPLHLAFIAGCPIGMRWQAVAGDRGVAKFCTPARRRSCKTWQELRLWLLSSRTLCLAVCTPARLVPEAPRRSLLPVGISVQLSQASVTQTLYPPVCENRMNQAGDFRSRHFRFDTATRASTAAGGVADSFHPPSATLD